LISLIQENINPKSGFFFFGEFWPLGDPQKKAWVNESFKGFFVENFHQSHQISSFFFFFFGNCHI
jgi:hypothetical protein